MRKKFLGQFLYLTAFKFNTGHPYKFIAPSILSSPYHQEKFVSSRYDMKVSTSDASNLIIRPDREGINHAGKLIRNGSLVAFPTETVYGLGANALNEEAVLSIFVAKGRPLTDPLIVHIVNKTEAFPLVEIDEDERVIFEAMADAFWPGPLTLIARAGVSIPRLVTANTGYVGIRAPAHPIAVALLNAAGVPIAAPSANRFAHVSPTRAEHVIADLGGKGVVVLNGECTADSYTQGSCEHGIESTIVKIDKASKKLTILRQGAITKADIETVLRSIGSFSHWVVDVMVRVVKMVGHEPDMKKSDMSDDSSETTSCRSSMVLINGERGGGDRSVVGEVAPGQAMTHYSPDVPCVIVSSFDSSARCSPLNTGNGDQGGGVVHTAEGLSELALTLGELHDSVVVDFAGQLRGLQQSSSMLASQSSPSRSLRGYRDLSPTGDAAEAARNLFDFLRWAENVSGCKRVLLASVKSAENEAILRDENNEVYDTKSSSTSYRLVYGLADRMFRAASGKSVHLKVLVSTEL